MSEVSKSVAISPPGAAAAGCTADCPGVQTDYGDGWLRSYTATAHPVGNWRFVKFTWERYRVRPSGSTLIDTPESVYNPSTSSDGLNEVRTETSTTWTEYTIDNLTAVFEYVAPPHTHLLVNSANKTTPVMLVYDSTTNLLVADY